MAAVATLGLLGVAGCGFQATVYGRPLGASAGQLVRHQQHPLINLKRLLHGAEDTCPPRGRRCGYRRTMIRLILAVAVAAALAGPAGAGHLKNPESALFHKGKIYVSVIGDVGADDGSIVIVNKKGNVVRTFVQAGDAKDPKGMAGVGKKLWVTDDDILRSFELSSGAPSTTVALPKAEFANDLAADKKGNLWVSDTRADALYRVTRKGKVKRFRLAPKFGSPNGLAFHPKTKELWFVTSAGAGSSVVARRTRKGKIKLVKANKSFAGLDGLVFVGENAHFTDFITGAVWRLSRKGQLKRRATIAGSPADLTYAPSLKRLLIPLIGAGHVVARRP